MKKETSIQGKIWSFVVRTVAPVSIAMRKYGWYKVGRKSRTRPNNDRSSRSRAENKRKRKRCRTKETRDPSSRECSARYYLRRVNKPANLFQLITTGPSRDSISRSASSDKLSLSDDRDSITSGGLHADEI